MAAKRDKKLENRIGKFFQEKAWGKETACALFDCCLNVSVAARRLYIHRNTLVYRAEKIKEETGLDVLHSFKDAVILYLYIDGHS